MALVVPPLQNDVSATLRNFPDPVSKGQRIPNTAVCLRFRSFATQFAVDIDTSKFSPIRNGDHMALVVPSLGNDLSF